MIAWCVLLSVTHSDDNFKSMDRVKTPYTLAHMMKLRSCILLNDNAFFNFMFDDIWPIIRYGFIRSNRYAVDEYWQTLEYCYVVGNTKSCFICVS